MPEHVASFRTPFAGRTFAAVAADAEQAALAKFAGSGGVVTLAASSQNGEGPDAELVTLWRCIVPDAPPEPPPPEPEAAPAPARKRKGG